MEVSKWNKSSTVEFQQKKGTDDTNFVEELGGNWLKWKERSSNLNLNTNGEGTTKDSAEGEKEHIHWSHSCETYLFLSCLTRSSWVY